MKPLFEAGSLIAKYMISARLTVLINPPSDNGARPQAVVHVDLDGAQDIYKAHGWPYPYADDPLFETGFRRMLDFLARNRVRATLFVIAQSLGNPRKRELIETAVSQGHELASHTVTHAYPRLIGSSQKRFEIAGSRERLEKLAGVSVRGFRAPGYQIDRESIELLASYGYQWDSSAFPTATFAGRLHVAAERLAAPGRVFDNALTELPLPDHRPSPVPFSPSYSLLCGLPYFRWGLKRARRTGAPLVLLFHLTDLADPMPPDRLNGWKSRIFTLSNLSGGTKLERCQEMLDLTAKWYRIVSTTALMEHLHATN